VSRTTTAAPVAVRVVEARPPAGTRRLPPVVGTIAGPGQVEAVAAGSRISLRATDDEGRFARETAIATAGLPYDRKQNTRLPAFRRLLRRGSSHVESITLHAELIGLPLVVSETTRQAIADYRARLERATRPIPRTVWVDERDREELETSEELHLRRR
jgi:hypothetical protein